MSDIKIYPFNIKRWYRIFWNTDKYISISIHALKFVKCNRYSCVFCYNQSLSASCRPVTERSGRFSLNQKPYKYIKMLLRGILKINKKWLTFIGEKFILHHVCFNVRPLTKLNKIYFANLFCNVWQTSSTTHFNNSL